MKIVNKLLYLFLRLFGAAFADPNFSPKTLLTAVFFQKILRFNSRVPWPVHWTSVVISPEKIIRGTRCPGLSVSCYLDGRNGITFGKNVWLGPRVSVISMNHDPYNYQEYIAEGPVLIGDDCWLAAGCIILPGVTLGKHVVVAAGAVVTRSFAEDNIVLAGVPARIVKRLDAYRHPPEEA